MSPPPVEDGQAAPRYRRSQPERTEPHRRVTRAFTTPQASDNPPPADPPGTTAPAADASSPGPETASPGSDAASAPAGFVENGVRTGYRVIDDYLRRGEQAAQQRAPFGAGSAWGSPNPSPFAEGDMTDRFRRALGFDPRQFVTPQGAQDLMRMWMNGWIKAMETVVGPMGTPHDVARAAGVPMPSELERMLRKAAQESEQDGSWWQQLDKERGAATEAAAASESSPAAEASSTAQAPFPDEDGWAYDPDEDIPLRVGRGSTRAHGHRTRTITIQRIPEIQLIGPDQQPVASKPALAELFHPVRYTAQVTKIKLRAATKVATVESLYRKGPKPRAALPPRTLELEAAGGRWVLTGSLPTTMEDGDWEAKVRDRKTGRFTGELELRIERAADPAPGSR